MNKEEKKKHECWCGNAFGECPLATPSNSEWEKEFDKELGHMFFFKDFSREIAIEFIRTLLTSETAKARIDEADKCNEHIEQSRNKGWNDGRTQALSEVLALIEVMMQDTRPTEDGVPVETYGYEETHNAALSDLRTTIINKNKKI